MIRLEVLEGHTPGRVYELAGDVCVIGRAPDGEVVLEDTHVSGRHARVVIGLHEATLEDLGSTNGTALLRGDERIDLSEPGEAVALTSGDVIELGRDDEICRLAVDVPDDDKSAHVAVVKRIEERDASAFADDPVTLRALYDAQGGIGKANDLDGVLEAVAAAVFELVAYSTHVTLVLEVGDAAATNEPAKDHRKKQRASRARNYLPVLTRARPSGEGPRSETAHEFVPVTRSVYRKVLEERSAVLAADAPKDVGRSPSIMGASVRSTIAVPLWRGDDILGVMQVDNRDAPGMLKPKDLDVLLVVAEHASLAVANARLIKRLQAAEEQQRHENRFLRDREQQRRGGSEPNIIGDSEVMRTLMQQIDKVADTGVTVLVEGETGTGKELIASALHYRSRRRDKLFVAQNCAALTESLLESELFGHMKGSFTGASDDKKGLFELADGSTLFLDEITEAPMAIQSKLLRALQEGEIRPVGSAEVRRVNVRVVAATNRKLEDEVKAGRFREDLYYRLKVFPLRVPPLRERRGDIPVLIPHFLSRYSAEIGKPVAGVTSETIDMLVAYDWPGNVRELQNEVQRLVIQVDAGDFITPELLSPQLRRGEEIVARAGGGKGDLRATMGAVEKYLILEALRENDGNKTTTAKRLGITREGLHKKLRNYAV